MALLTRLVRTAIGSVFYVALAFVGAGTVTWPRGWFYGAVFIGVSLLGALIVELANPGLLAARAKGMRRDTKTFDRRFYLFFLPLVLAYPLVAGADAMRFCWTSLPEWTLPLGAVLFVASSAFGTWTMIVNRHAETTVRIADEQTVVTTGPYRLVRHPMYLGTVIGLPGTALMLGSGWALAVCAVLAALFVWRTAREDQTLRQELEGYAAYAATTRHRLLPGLW